MSNPVTFDQLARAFLRLRSAVLMNCHETKWVHTSLGDTYNELNRLTEDLKAQVVYDEDGELVMYKSVP